MWKMCHSFERRAEADGDLFQFNCVRDCEKSGIWVCKCLQDQSKRGWQSQIILEAIHVFNSKPTVLSVLAFFFIRLLNIFNSNGFGSDLTKKITERTIHPAIFFRSHLLCLLWPIIQLSVCSTRGVFWQYLVSTVVLLSDIQVGFNNHAQSMVAVWHFQQSVLDLCKTYKHSSSSFSSSASNSYCMQVIKSSILEKVC